MAFQLAAKFLKIASRIKHMFTHVLFECESHEKVGHGQHVFLKEFCSRCRVNKSSIFTPPDGLLTSVDNLIRGAHWLRISD